MQGKIFSGVFLFIIGIALVIRFFILLPAVVTVNYASIWFGRFVGLVIYSLIAGFGAYMIWGKSNR